MLNHVIFNPITQEAETGGFLLVQDQLELHRENLSLKKKKTTRAKLLYGKYLDSESSGSHSGK